MDFEKLYLKEIVTSCWTKKVKLWEKLSKIETKLESGLFDINFYKIDLLKKIIKEYDINSITKFEDFESIFKQELETKLNTVFFKNNSLKSETGLKESLPLILKDKLKIKLSFSYKAKDALTLEDYKESLLNNHKKELNSYTKSNLENTFKLFKENLKVLELEKLLNSSYKWEDFMNFFIENQDYFSKLDLSVNYNFLSNRIFQSPKNFNAFDYKSTLNILNKSFKDPLFKNFHSIFLQWVFWIDSKNKEKRKSYEIGLNNFYLFCINLFLKKNLDKIENLNSLYNFNRLIFNLDFFYHSDIEVNKSSLDKKWEKEFYLKEGFTNFNNYEQLANFLKNLRKKVNLPTKEIENPFDIQNIKLVISWEQTNEVFYTFYIASTILPSLLLGWKEIWELISLWWAKQANRIMLYKNQIINLYYIFVNLKNILNLLKTLKISNEEERFDELESFLFETPLANSYQTSWIKSEIKKLELKDIILQSPILNESVYGLLKICKKNKNIIFDFLRPQLILIHNQNWIIKQSDFNSIIHELFIVSFPSNTLKFLSENILISLSKLKKANNNLVSLNNIYNEVVSYITNYEDSVNELEKINKSLKKLTNYKIWLELKKWYNSFICFITEEIKKINELYLNNKGMDSEISNILLQPEYLNSIIKFTGSIPSFLDKIDTGLDRFKLKDFNLEEEDTFKRIELKTEDIKDVNLDLKSQIQKFYKNKKDYLRILKQQLGDPDDQDLKQSEQETLACLKDLLNGKIEKKFESIQKQYFINYGKVFNTFKILLGNKEKGWLALKPKKLFSKMLEFFEGEILAFRDFSTFKDKIIGKESEFLDAIKEFHPSMKWLYYNNEGVLKKDEYILELLTVKIEDIKNPNYWFAWNHSVCCMSFWNIKQYDYMFQKGFSIINVYYKNKVIANSVIYTSHNNNFLILDNIEIAPNYKFLDDELWIYNSLYNFTNFITEQKEIEFIGLWAQFNDINMDFVENNLKDKLVGRRKIPIGFNSFKLPIDDVNSSTSYYQDAKEGIYLLKGSLKEAKKYLYILENQ